MVLIFFPGQVADLGDFNPITAHRTHILFYLSDKTSSYAAKPSAQSGFDCLNMGFFLFYDQSLKYEKHQWPMGEMLSPPHPTGDIVSNTAMNSVIALLRSYFCCGNLCFYALFPWQDFILIAGYFAFAFLFDRYYGTLFVHSSLNAKTGSATAVDLN